MFLLLVFDIICKHLRDVFILFPDVINYGFLLYYWTLIKVLNFPSFGK